MSTYTAVVCDASSIGGALANFELPQIATGLTSNHRNPAVATARIRTIMDPHIVSASPGGFISADFTIPAFEAQRYRETLRYGAVVWMFDGATPIFFGYNEQPTWNPDGSCLMNVSGPWTLLAKSQMREAWELWDMTLLQPGTANAENTAAQAQIGNNGALRLAFATGSAVAASDRVSMEYLLFGEAAAAYDGKTITAFEFDISDNAFSIFTNLRFRVVGCNTPGAAGDTLYDTNAAGSSGKQGALNLNGSNQGSVTWTNTAGYRCLRFQLIASGGAITGGVNSYVTLDRIRIGTREALFPTVGSTLDTAAVARDVLKPRVSNNSQLAFDLPQEFWRSSVVAVGAANSDYAYAWGLDPVSGTGAAPNSNLGVTGFTSLEWQDPATILTALAAIDGYNIGFYLPYNGRGGYDQPGSASSGTFGGADVGSYWLSAPPQLYYQPFPDPVYAPDYTIHTREGAQVTPATSAQPLVDRLYVNYQQLKGRQLSVVQTDSNTLNYLWAQGFQRAEDYAIQPSVGDATLAASLGEQTMITRRQPYASETITIMADGTSRYPILKGGATIPCLATVRPSSMRIVDMAGGGLSHGYATSVEWWGQTLGTPETLTITMGQPGEVSAIRAHGHLANRYHKERRRIL